MTRCALCGRRIWPWQRTGWIVGLAAWHGSCWRAAWHAKSRAEVLDQLEEVGIFFG